MTYIHKVIDFKLLSVVMNLQLLQLQDAIERAPPNELAL